MVAERREETGADAARAAIHTGGTQRDSAGSGAYFVVTFAAVVVAVVVYICVGGGALRRRRKRKRRKSVSASLRVRGERDG